MLVSLVVTVLLLLIAVTLLLLVTLSKSEEAPVRQAEARDSDTRTDTRQDTMAGRRHGDISGQT